MNGFSLQLELQCPQCGAGVTLHETDRLFTCDYCRVRLYIPLRQPLRCYFSPVDTTDAGALYFAPYWRFRGVACALLGSQIIHRILDTTVRGCSLNALPYSLGVRPQAIKMRFLTPDVPGHFLRPDLTQPEFLQRLGSGLPASPKEHGNAVACHAFIGETVSLVYTPVRLDKGLLLDGLTGRVLHGGVAQGESPGPSEEMPGNALEFWSTLCPECGGDLEGGRDSAALPCPDCASTWEAGPGGFERIEALCMDSREPPDAWLPFWQIEAAMPGLSLASRADLVRLTGLAKPISPEMETSPCAFTLPAFKVSPNIFFRLARHMTIGQPGTASRSTPGGGARFPANLPASEALQGVPILLGALCPAREILLPGLESTEVSLRATRLLWVPFKKRGAELVQTHLGFALPQAALQFGAAP